MIFFFDFEVAGEDGGAIGEEEEMAGGHVEFAVFVGNGHEPNTKLKIMIWGEEKYEFWIKKHGDSYFPFLISCKECLANKILANYYGESNFNGYTRGKQHLEKYMSKNKNTMEKSAMRKHAKEVYENRDVEYLRKVANNREMDHRAPINSYSVIDYINRKQENC